MQLLDIKKMAHTILENRNIESSFIEYKKSVNFKDKILKTACAFANNYMNDEIGLLFIGIEEVDDKKTGEKAQKDKNIQLKSGRYIRIGRDSRLPNPIEEFELLKKFAGFSFSSNLNATATIDDLSYEYMKEYLLQTGAKKDIREMSKLEMAKSMGLVSESEYGGYRAKNFNVEFLKSFNGGTTQETTQETTKEMNFGKSIPEKIVELMIMNPNISARQIADNLDISFDGVRYHIKNLKASGRIKREGSTKSGKWVVIK